MWKLSNTLLDNLWIRNKSKWKLENILRRSVLRVHWKN